TASTTANITARTLHVTATGVDKVYDGTVAAVVVLSNDRVSGDDVLLSSTAMFADRNVGTNKPIAVSAISITGGADAGNYTLGNATAATTADITARTLAISATGINKIYDGTTAASVTLSDNRIAGDVFTDLYTSAAFDTKNVGTSKTVS